MKIVIMTDLVCVENASEGVNRSDIDIEED